MNNNGWLDISLKQYRYIKDIMLDVDISDEDRMWQLVQVVYNVDTNEIPMQDLKKYINGLGFIERPMPKMKIKDRYKVDGREYELRKELGDFSVAQFIDWQNYMKEGGDIDNAENLLSVFFIPVGCKYGENYDIQKVKEDISNMKIVDVNTILAFFLRQSKAYMIRSLSYSQKKTMKAMKGWKKKMKVRLMYLKMKMKIMVGE